AALESHKPLMKTGSMPVPAPARTVYQASKMRRTSAARTTALFRSNIASMGVLGMSSAHHAALTKVDMGKLPIRIFECEADWRRDLGPAAANLGLGELEAVGLHNAHAVLRAGDGVQDRLAAHLDESLDLGARPAAVDVELEIDVCDDRVVESV